MNQTSFLQRRIALPQEHGSWIFLLSPLLIGLSAAGNLNPGSLLLIVACLAGFLIRQPITLLVKINTGRRPLRDRPAAIIWTTIYAFAGVIAVVGLIMLGYQYILVLAIPGIPVFLWHLILVSRRAERRQIGVEIIASGVLALSAPAAYWVGLDHYNPYGWWLFILTWLQSAASIVYAFLRLAQRELEISPELRVKLLLGRRAILYASFDIIFVLVFSSTGYLPTLLFFPYLIQWGEVIWGVIYPAIGLKPTRIGIRQLVISTIFTVLFILTWNIGYL